MKIIQIILFVGLLLSISGCVNSQQARGKQLGAYGFKDEIKSIYIENLTKDYVEYIFYGVTVFTNKKENIDEVSVKDDLIDSFSKSLKEKNKTVVNSIENSDAILRIKPGSKYGNSKKVSVKEFGFARESLLGSSFGIEAQVFIKIELMDTKTKHVLAATTRTRGQLVLTDESERTWTKLSDDLKEELIFELKNQINEISVESIDALGF